jgi:DNA polymerase III delta prime subunit
MVHRKKTMKIPYSKENPGAKAVLLSGPPGIGKSTVAGVVARAQGYDILELNASDTRSKKTLKQELGDVLDNSVLFMKQDQKGDHGRCSPRASQPLQQSVSVCMFCLTPLWHRTATAQNKRVVIMDEVDGMSGSDRGGMQELIRLIKTSKVPIICICNDRQSTKVRGERHPYALERRSRGFMSSRVSFTPGVYVPTRRTGVSRVQVMVFESTNCNSLETLTLSTLMDAATHSFNHVRAILWAATVDHTHPVA